MQDQNLITTKDVHPAFSSHSPFLRHKGAPVCLCVTTLWVRHEAGWILIYYINECKKLAVQKSASLTSSGKSDLLWYNLNYSYLENWHLLFLHKATIFMDNCSPELNGTVAYCVLSFWLKHTVLGVGEQLNDYWLNKYIPFLKYGHSILYFQCIEMLLD